MLIEVDGFAECSLDFPELNSLVFREFEVMKPPSCRLC